MLSRQNYHHRTRSLPCARCCGLWHTAPLSVRMTNFAQLALGTENAPALKAKGIIKGCGKLACHKMLLAEGHADVVNEGHAPTKQWTGMGGGVLPHSMTSARASEYIKVVQASTSQSCQVRACRHRRVRSSSTTDRGL